MKVYGTNLHPAWVALCCTPGIGGALSFIGACKWDNEAATLPQIFEEKNRQYLAAKELRRLAPKECRREGSGDSVVSVVVMEGAKDGYFEEVSEVSRKQAIYTVTALVSSILSLALMIQKVTTPLFQVCALWTAVYAVVSYYAVSRVAAVEKGAREEEPVFPKPVSYAVPAMRYMYELV